MVPQMTVVADLTPSEDLLSLKPGYAVGDCHARRLPSVHEAQLCSIFRSESPDIDSKPDAQARQTRVAAVVQPKCHVEMPLTLHC